MAARRAGFRCECRIFSEAPCQAGRDRERIAFGVIYQDARDLLAVLKTIYQALQLAIRVPCGERLSGADQAFRQHLSVIVQIPPSPERVGARLKERESQ